MKWIIIAGIIGLLGGFASGILIGMQTFKYQATPIPLLTKYFSFPEELFQARKGDSMYLRVVNDTTKMEFYHTDYNMSQNDAHSIIILTDSVFYACLSPVIMEQLNIR